MPETEIEEFFDWVSKAHPGRGHYLPVDRYRDFRALFLANEQGRRVLHEILSFCGVLTPTVPPGAGPIDPYRAMVREGKREVGIDILKVLHEEPLPAPDTANRKRT